MIPKKNLVCWTVVKLWEKGADLHIYKKLYLSLSKTVQLHEHSKVAWEQTWDWNEPLWQHFSKSKNKYTSAEVFKFTKHTKTKCHRLYSVNMKTLFLNRVPMFKNWASCSINEPKNKLDCSRVTFIIDPRRQPLFFLERVELDFSISVLGTFLSYPHSMVTRNAVVLLGACEESTLWEEI